MTCECSRASGTIRLTLKTVQFGTPVSSAWPLDILHVGKLDDAVHIYIFFPSALTFSRHEIRRASRVTGAQNQRVYGVCVAPIWVGFGYFYSPDPQKNQFGRKNRTQNGPNGPRSPIFFFNGFGFLGFEPNSNVVGQDNPQLPRANENIV